MLLIKKEVLKFIRTMGAVTYEELSAFFACQEHRASNRLTELKREGLVDNKPRGKWYLTYYGEKKLAYYEKRDRRR